MSAALEELVAAALRPQTLAEALRLRLSGGLTAAQVLERLPDATQRALLGAEPNPTLARRAALAEVALALDTLVQVGRARRARAQMKSALVDVYRGG